MKYAVDRIEEDIVVLENIKTGEILEVSISNLPKGIHEGSILVKDNDEFLIDLDTEKERRESLRERLERLKGNN
jgi:hypothetical protein